MRRNKRRVYGARVDLPAAVIVIEDSDSANAGWASYGFLPQIKRTKLMIFSNRSVSVQKIKTFFHAHRFRVITSNCYYTSCYCGKKFENHYRPLPTRFEPYNSNVAALQKSV